MRHVEPKMSIGFCFEKGMQNHELHEKGTFKMYALKSGKIFVFWRVLQGLECMTAVTLEKGLESYVCYKSLFNLFLKHDQIYIYTVFATFPTDAFSGHGVLLEIWHFCFTFLISIGTSGTQSSPGFKIPLEKERDLLR